MRKHIMSALVFAVLCAPAVQVKASPVEVCVNYANFAGEVRSNLDRGVKPSAIQQYLYDEFHTTPVILGILQDITLAVLIRHHASVEDAQRDIFKECMYSLGEGV